MLGRRRRGEKSVQRGRACAVLVPLVSRLLLMKGKKKKKDFYLSGKKARKLKARGRVSCSARCCFASILARVWQALLLSVVKNQRRKKGALIPRGAYKAPFLLLLNLHSWTQLLAPLLLEQLNY